MYATIKNIFSKNNESDKISPPPKYFRLPCGKLRLYSVLGDHKEFGKSFNYGNSCTGTGPYKEWESMIVEAEACDYRYLKPYAKKIDGTFHLDDDDNLWACKNCEAYATWELYDSDIMICTERCLNCTKEIYFHKVIRIQRKWKKYKNIDIRI